MAQGKKAFLFDQLHELQIGGSNPILWCAIYHIERGGHIAPKNRLWRAKGGF